MGDVAMMNPDAKKELKKKALQAIIISLKSVKANGFKARVKMKPKTKKKEEKQQDGVQHDQATGKS